MKKVFKISVFTLFCIGILVLIIGIIFISSIMKESNVNMLIKNTTFAVFFLFFIKN